MSNLPIKVENGIFGKIKLFFRKLFFKDEQLNEIEEVQIKNIVSNNQKKFFEDNMKVEVNDDFVKDIKRNEFITQIETNPDLLYDLPLEKIEKWSEYYSYLIEKEKEENKKLEEKLSRLKKVGQYINTYEKIKISRSHWPIFLFSWYLIFLLLI